VNIVTPALRAGIACLPAFVLAACLQLDPEASERLASGAASSSTIGSTDMLDSGSPARVDAAMRNPARLAADREQDERRKAADVLHFFGIKPGMVVLDLYSGDGYYAELLSSIVGPTGRVVAHNKVPYLAFAKAELAERTADGRPDNVEQLIVENNQLELAANVFDAVIMIRAYHDVYYVSEDSGWVEIDRPGLMSEIFRALKPGGVLGIVDHVAESGTQPATGGRLHRIDPAVIKRDMAAVGFVFDGESDVLRNSIDDYSQNVFAPSVQDWTDRIVLRFHKPRS